MNGVTFTFNGHTWTVVEFGFGYEQGGLGNKAHGTPIPKALFVRLMHDPDNDGLLDAAKSPGDHYDCTLNYIRNNATVKQFSFKQAIVTDLQEVGKFDPNPAIGGGIFHDVTLLVEDVTS